MARTVDCGLRNADFGLNGSEDDDEDESNLSPLTSNLTGRAYRIDAHRFTVAWLERAVKAVRPFTARG